MDGKERRTDEGLGHNGDRDVMRQDYQCFRGIVSDYWIQQTKDETHKQLLIIFFYLGT